MFVPAVCVRVFGSVWRLLEGFEACDICLGWTITALTLANPISRKSEAPNVSDEAVCIAVQRCKKCHWR